jgi:hypothetical protein
VLPIRSIDPAASETKLSISNAVANYSLSPPTRQERGSENERSTPPSICEFVGPLNHLSFYVRFLMPHFVQLTVTLLEIGIIIAMDTVRARCKKTEARYGHRRFSSRGFLYWGVTMSIPPNLSFTLMKRLPT